ncbi:MAG: hypothetical protein AMJ79_01335 [Phycisphaerae bacterium SM23_30]|nr:MAG: hypothetical protein AMJ79_01335 [Phycisphaerae bacterium SM23_30]
MAARDFLPIKILSLLSGDLEVCFRRTLVDQEQVEYFRGRVPASIRWPTALFDRRFWARLSVEAYDLVVFELSSAALGELLQMPAARSGFQFWAGPIWLRLPTATGVVLKDADRVEVEQAAQLGFDGLWTAPWQAADTLKRLKGALQRAGCRWYHIERYSRVRGLCRQVNRKRRQLRDKVDLLCRDLVNSNIQFTETLQDLQRVYDFQSSLVGEFDRRYMLYKALGGLKLHLSDSSAAIYLCNPGGFAAHVAAFQQPEIDNPADLEELFTKTVVKEVLRTGHCLLVRDAGTLTPISSEQQGLLGGWSLLGLPVAHEGRFIGVVVVYRQTGKEISESEKNRIKPLMRPLAHALDSLQKLEHVICTR